MKNKWKKLLIMITALIIFSEFIPLQELRADENTHRVYDCGGIRVEYDINSSWNKSSHVEVTVFNVSDITVENWILELEYENEIILNSLWNGIDLSDETTSSNNLIIGSESYNSYIESGESISFGIIVEGFDSVALLPISIVAREVLEEFDQAVENNDTYLETEFNDSVDENTFAYNDIGEYSELNSTNELSDSITEWALYASNKSESLLLSGNVINISGNVFAGGDLLCQGTEFNVDGSIRVGGKANINTYLSNGYDLKENSDNFDNPVWTTQILNLTSFMLELTQEDMSQSDIVNDGFYYNSEDVIINGTAFGGEVVIVSDGDIIVNIDHFVDFSKIILFSKNGNIDINASEGEVNGMLYAPNGQISINVNDFSVVGCIVSDTISFSGSTLTISSYNIIQDFSSCNANEDHVTQNLHENENCNDNDEIIGWADKEVLLVANSYEPISFFLDTKLHDCSSVEIWENDSFVTYMYDDGFYSLNSDDIGGDGIYSCKLSIDKTTVAERLFYLKMIMVDGTSIDRVVVIRITDFTDSFAIMDVITDNVFECKMSDEYVNGDLDSKIRSIVEILKFYEECEYIENDSIHITSNYVVSCTTIDGIPLDFACETNVNYNSYGSGTDESRTSQYIMLNNSPYQSINNNIRVLYMIAFNGRNDIYEEEKNLLEESGVYVTLNYSPNYYDYMTCLADGYDVVVFSSHGVYDSEMNESRIFSGVNVDRRDDESRNFFNTEARNGLVRFLQNEDDPNIFTVELTEKFFREKYSNFPDNNTIVLFEACELFGVDDNINESFGFALDSIGVRCTVGFVNSVESTYSRKFCHYFITSLNNDLSVSASCNAAIEIVGANDDVIYDDDGILAYPYLFGDISFAISMGTVQNASFEYYGSVYGPPNLLDIYGWMNTGDIKLISNLTADILPTDGNYMAMITTGIGSGESSYYTSREGSTLYQSFRIPEGVSTLYFDFNMVSEEPMEWVGSKYDDSFNVVMINNETESEFTLYASSVNVADWGNRVNTNFDGGDNTVYQTGWDTVSVDISDYAGMNVTIVFIVYDVGDSSYDTAVLIDNIKFGG